MACIKKEKHGHCNHFQCPFPEQSGYECVDIVFDGASSFCEVGLNCVEECQHSFTSIAQELAAKKAFEAAYPIDEIEA